MLETSRRLLGPEHPTTLASMNNLAETLRAQGDLVGARKLQEQVLETRRRLLGPEHPATSVAAWNLLHSVLAAGDREGARALLASDLRWLLHREPATLRANQQTIRRYLAAMLKAGREEQD